MDWFLYDNGLHHERVKTLSNIFSDAFLQTFANLQICNFQFATCNLLLSLQFVVIFSHLCHNFNKRHLFLET